jgi:hypothetical protein
VPSRSVANNIINYLGYQTRSLNKSAKLILIPPLTANPLFFVKQYFFKMAVNLAGFEIARMLNDFKITLKAYNISF